MLFEYSIWKRIKKKKIIIKNEIYRFFFAAFELSRIIDAPQETVFGAVNQ